VYVVPRSGQALDARAVRASLARVLPSYMLPSAVVSVDQLPLTRSGKVDRARLPPPDAGPARDEISAAPRDDDEQRLVSIWTALLPGRRFGVTDGFFDIGGHSLVAVQLVSRIKEQWALDFPLIRVFQKPTIAEQAEEIRRLRAAPAPVVVPVLKRREIPVETTRALTDDQVDTLLRELLARTSSADDANS
jgi:hypothetical protein